MNVVLLEQGTPLYTNNFPETPDSIEAPLHQLPSAEIQDAHDALMPFDEATRWQQVLVRKHGGEMLVAQVVGNLGDGYILYRRETPTRADGFLTPRERFEVGRDELYRYPRHES